MKVTLFMATFVVIIIVFSERFVSFVMEVWTGFILNKIIITQNNCESNFWVTPIDKTIKNNNGGKNKAGYSNSNNSK